MSRFTIQRITIAFGIVYFVIGILGFIPGITVFTDNPVGPVPGEGLLLGIFAINVVHNIAHLIVGAVLILGGLSPVQVVRVNKAMAGLFLLLVVASFIAPIVEGVAINPPDTILHLASALLAGYLGFVAPREAVARTS